MVGVAIGVAVLIVVLSVMNGFEHELRARILSLTSHATITAFGEGLAGWQEMRATALTNPRVTAAAPFVEAETLLIADRPRGASSAATLRGIEPSLEAEVSSLGDRLTHGSMDSLRSGEFNVILGEELANALGVQLGDAVVVAVAKGNVTPAGVLPRLRRFQVGGIFRSGMYEIDATLAVVHVADAGAPAATRRQRDGAAARSAAIRTRRRWQCAKSPRELGGGLYVEDWTQRNANFFRSIELTKRMMFFILLLVVAVAAFNIVSTLVMAVKDKQPDIAILRTIGARPASVLAIFTTQGTVIGLLGTLGGVALGVLLSRNLESIVHGIERVFGVRFMDASVYLMSDLPARVEPRDVLLIAGTAFALCCLSTLYPAWRAATTDPARALRHD